MPLISEMQSARTIERKKLEITPILQLSTTQKQVGVQFRTGIGEKMDVHFKGEFGRFENRYSYGFGSTKYSTDYGFFTCGLKYGIVKDHLAVNFPIGIYMERNAVAFGFGPSLIGTFPIVKDKVELSLIPKINTVILNEGMGLFFTAHTNLALSSDLNKWAIRPEVSCVLPRTIYGGIGFSYVFDLKKAKKD